MNVFDKLQKNGILFDFNQIKKICDQYKIQELSIFGSSLREDFNKNSDIDILVSFKKEAEISLFDIIDIENKISSILDRKIDLIEKESLKNPIRKKNILNTIEVIYAA